MTKLRVFRDLPYIAVFSLILALQLPALEGQETDEPAPAEPPAETVAPPEAEPAAEALGEADPAADEVPAAEAADGGPVPEPPADEPSPSDSAIPEEPAPAVQPADEPAAEEPTADKPAADENPAPAAPPAEDPAPAEPPAEPPAQPKPEPTKPAPKKRDFTAATLAEVDDDFAYQGEYGGAMGFGLQVVALGDGKFDGVLYRGGLPGAGWYGGEKIQFSGERQGDLIELAGEPYSLKVRGEYAELLWHGSHAGFLNKTQRISPTMHAAPPRGAKVLFNGSSTEAFDKAKLTDEGWLAAGTSTNDKFQDFRLHIEFRLPYKPHARDQGRGNSGVYIQRRYEVQVLDSFGLEGAANECGGLYRQQPPDVNMCLPPLSWQTYDIYFRAARFDDDGNKTENARITVLHNGYPVHDDYEITGKTGAGRQETPDPGEIYLQDHGNPVAFRNIWLVEGEGTPPVECKPKCVPVKRRWRLFCR